MGLLTCPSSGVQAHHTTCLFPVSKQALFWSKGYLFSHAGCYPKQLYLTELVLLCDQLALFSNSSTEIRVNTELWIFFFLFVSRDVPGNRFPYSAGFNGAVPALGGRRQLGRGCQALSTSNKKHQHKMFSKYFLAVLFLVFTITVLTAPVSYHHDRILLSRHR